MGIPEMEYGLNADASNADTLNGRVSSAMIPPLSCGRVDS